MFIVFCFTAVAGFALDETDSSQEWDFRGLFLTSKTARRPKIMVLALFLS